jgi:hypothetical protein
MIYIMQRTMTRGKLIIKTVVEMCEEVVVAYKQPG